MIKTTIVSDSTEALFSRSGIQGFCAWNWVRPVVLGLLLGLNFLGFCSGREKHFEQNDVEIEFELRSDGQLVIVASRLENPDTSTIKVWVEGGNQKTDPPISGRLKVEQNRLIFQPRFPFVTGMTYDVVVETNADPKPFRTTLRLPSEGGAVSKITEIYPSLNELPENTLKFYIHFSKPMRKGDIYRYFRLRAVGGEDVELPFLEIEQEFWSRDSKRLTLLLDPGRIKRGLKPREDMGPILVAGKDYELVIDGDWPDSNGRKLGEDFVKRFRALPEDHTQPDPAEWKIWLPKAGTTNPIVIRFAESLDHSMLFRSIVIRDESLNAIEGTISVTGREKRMTFEPSRPWPPGNYVMTVDSDLEDNAGNSVGRQFDVDLFEKTEPSDASPVIKWKFQIK